MRESKRMGQLRLITGGETEVEVKKTAKEKEKEKEKEVGVI